MKTKIYEYDFIVEPFDTDYKGNLSLPQLVRSLLNGCNRHASQWGFGYKNLKEGNHAWVLFKITIELNDVLKMGETVHVRTWVDSIMRTFSQRNFEIHGENDRIVGYARSVWALIDIEKKAPASLVGSGIEDFLVNQQVPLSRSKKIIDPMQGECKSYIVKYSDLDVNRHMNSAKYLEHNMNTFTIDDLANKRIQKIELEYVEESFFDETINIQKTEESQGDFILIHKNQDGHIVCKSRIVLVDEE